MATVNTTVKQVMTKMTNTSLQSVEGGYDQSKNWKVGRSDLSKTERSERSDLPVFERSERSNFPKTERSTAPIA